VTTYQGQDINTKDSINKMKIILPKQIETALSTLIKNGYQAYIVGGCVRDILLNKNPKDYDITTNALPQQIISLFSNYYIIDKGLKHGTVTVIINNMPIEITTYRIDGEYSDNRHPDKVSFTGSLKDDLSRRDFTINAIAYNHQQGLIDYFEGRADLEKRLIRCVGQPDKRFTEDALRILRALRLSAVLNFSIEDNTAWSIRKNKDLLRNIAMERISSEFSIIICADGVENVIREFIDVFGVFIPEAIHMKNFHQNNMYNNNVHDVLNHVSKVVNKVPGELHLKLAAFFHDIAIPFTYSADNLREGHFCRHHKDGFEMTKDILTRLKYDNKTIEKVTKLVLYHDVVIDNDERIIKRWLNKLSEQVMRELITLKKADILAQNPQCHYRLKELDQLSEIIDKIIAQEQCFSLKDLAVDGHDLIKLGIPQGKLIGQVLNYLLSQVIDGNLPNKKEELLKAVASIPKNN